MTERKVTTDLGVKCRGGAVVGKLNSFDEGSGVEGIGSEAEGI